MNEPPRLSRSPSLMDPRETGLLVVDVQGKLVDLIPGHDSMVWNITRLIQGAEVLGVSVGATEQYPEGLGPTVRPIRELLSEVPSKLTFSCGVCSGIFDRWRREGRFRVLVSGIETHVCVMQTVLDLLADGFEVYVAVDAVGSRHEVDRDTALRRMESAGATLVTTEMSLFEWCERAGTPQFRRISQIVRQPDPAES